MNNMKKLDDEGGFMFDFSAEREKELCEDKEFIAEMMKGDEENEKPGDALSFGEGYFNDKDYRREIAQCGMIPDEDDNENDNGDEFSASPFERLMSKMEDITEGQKLVYKRVLDLGEGKTIPDLSLIVYDYKFFYEYGDEPFDTSRVRNKPDRQRLGVGMLLEGLEIAFLSMKKRERSAFILDYKVMYGEMGVPPRIPAKSNVYAEIEIIDYVERNLIDDFFEKTEEEKSDIPYLEVLKVVYQCREDGNSAYRNQRFPVALRKYMRALDVLYAAPVTNDEEDNHRQKELMKINLNLAQSFLKLKRAPSSIRYCNEVLAYDSSNVKAIYRKGKALMQLCKYDECAAMLKKANLLCPNSKEVLECIRENEIQKAQYGALERRRCLDMFGLKACEPKKPSPEVPDVTSDFGVDLKEKLTLFKSGDSVHFPPILKSALSASETKILEAIVGELNLWMREKDDSWIIRKM